MITAFGAIVIPLTLLCAFWPEWLMVLVVFTGGFEAAASMVLGSFGVQLNILPALVFMSHLVLLRILGGRFAGQAEVVRLMNPLLIFLGIVIVGALLLPNLFSESLMIWPQKSDEHVQALLTFSGANITQTLYMVLNVGVTFSFAIYIASYPTRARRLLYAYLASGLTVVVVSVWQFASRVSGIPFPDGFFYSNPGWAVLSNQMIGFGIPRTNGPMTEPSALGAFLCGIIYASGWLMLHGRSNRLVKVTLVSAILGVMLSTSTTGFVILALGAAITGIYVVTTARADVVRRFGRVAVPVAVVAIVGTLSLPILAPNIVDAAGVVVQQTLSKTDSQSYDERSEADWDSIALAVPTYGLGAGWGSNRSSSLIPGIIGNAGLPGLAIIIWAILSMRRAIRTTAPFVRNPDHQWALQGLSAGTLGYFLATMVSGPTISSLTFYALLGTQLGVVARARLATAERSRAALMQANGQAVPDALAGTP